MLVEKDRMGVGEGTSGFASEGDMKEAEEEYQEDEMEEGGGYEEAGDNFERRVDIIILPRGCERCCCCGGTITVSPKLSNGALSKASAATGGFERVHSSLQCSGAFNVDGAVGGRPRIAGGGLRKPWAIRRERNEQQQELLHDARIIAP